ncbi:hypothetical protein HDU67_000197 [Dinochytrium kinnereticum]|nr:hypothetical protein HDU67_000197 [Dinochytrium kinnereticum]
MRQFAVFNMESASGLGSIHDLLPKESDAQRWADSGLPGMLPFGGVDGGLRRLSTPPSSTAAPARQVRFNDPQDTAIQDLSDQFKDMKIFVNKVHKQLEVLTAVVVKSPSLKTKAPPADKTAVGLHFDVDSFVAAAPPGVRCYYCGLPGHFKDQCEILVKDILAGARVMIERDRRLHWVVSDPDNGGKKLGEEVGDATAYQAALAQVDPSFTIESYSFGLGASPRWKPPPLVSGSSSEGEETVEELQLVEIGWGSEVLSPHEVTRVEALRVVNSLILERIGSEGSVLQSTLFSSACANPGDQIPPKAGQASIYLRSLPETSQTSLPVLQKEFAVSSEAPPPPATKGPGISVEESVPRGSAVEKVGVQEMDGDRGEGKVRQPGRGRKKKKKTSEVSVEARDVGKGGGEGENVVGAFGGIE